MAEPINWRLGLVIFFAVLALAIPQAALLPLLDRDEPRFAEASREMLQSGNYVVPMFNHAPRYAKPPLIYWCQTLSYRVFGENAFAARLPSLLATAGTALLLVTWGMRLGSPQVGVGAALLYAFCFQAVQQGRVATADALLIFFMTLTAFTGWKIVQSQVPGRIPRICFVVLALAIAGGFLAKGPEALLPVFALLWLARGVRWNVIISLLAGLALVLFWAIPAYIETNGEYWKQGLSEGVGQRIFSGMQGHGASSIGAYLFFLPLYVVIFWLSALPWSPLLIARRKQLFAGWNRDITDWYLLLNAALIFFVFTLMVTKLPHYTLPAFPFLALAFARRWEAVGLPKCTLVQMGWITGGAFALLTVTLVPFAMARHAMPSPVNELIREAQKHGDFAPETQFATVDFQEPSVIWEMRRVANAFGQSIPESDVRKFIDQPGPRGVILSQSAMGRISDQFPGITPGIHVYNASGFNAAKGQLIQLFIIWKK